MEKIFKVAGIVYSVRNNAETDVPLTFENYSPFEIEVASDSDVLFTLHVDGLLCNTKEPDLYRSQDSYLIDVPVWEDPTFGILKVSSSLREGRLLMKTCNRSCFDMAALIMFALAASNRGALVMHSSVIVKDGKGYLFLGKSGVGKSTHTSLWVNSIPGAHLLNDDNPVLCVEDDIVKVYGSPWSGNTCCYLNEGYPVGAFVEVRRSLHNSMWSVGLPEAISLVTKASVARLAIPGIGERLLKTLLFIVKNYTVFILECLPESRAAVMCHNILLKTNTGKIED